MNDPEVAVIDLDSVLFKAAQSGEKIQYHAVHPKLGIVASFDSAKGYKNWLETIEVLGFDPEFNYGGNVEDLTRESTIEIGDVKKCYKTFDSIIKEWVRRSGCKTWVGYVSKKSGAKNFRYAISVTRPYKGNRSSSVKPHYLEEVRKYAISNPYVKVARGTIEVDDVVCAVAQKVGDKACVISVDKDSRGVTGTWYFLPDEMDQPEYSDPNIIGELEYDHRRSVAVGHGTLFWLYQCVAGDGVDNIQGITGIGAKGAVELLQRFSGKPVHRLKEAVRVVSEAYREVYGDNAEGIFIEMSHLVYMRKSQQDECFWIPLIKECFAEMVEGGGDV